MIGYICRGNDNNTPAAKWVDRNMLPVLLIEVFVIVAGVALLIIGGGWMAKGNPALLTKAKILLRAGGACLASVLIFECFIGYRHYSQQAAQYDAMAQTLGQLSQAFGGAKNTQAPAGGQPPA